MEERKVQEKFLQMEFTTDIITRRNCFECRCFVSQFRQSGKVDFEEFRCGEISNENITTPLHFI